MLFTAIICLHNLPVKGQIPAIAARYPVIPYPASLIPGEGDFTVNARTKIVVQHAAFRAEAAALVSLIKSTGGPALHYDKAATVNCIVLKEDPTIRAEEGYHLLISPKQIVLSASAPAGIFWGIETIRQLLPPDGAVRNSGHVEIPAADIMDHPAFPWRGMHLDVARHFFSVAYLKKFIDRMALYKLNRLHLHLTDDQGWRIQIKKYPLLTEQGAWRTFDRNDSECMQLAKENPDFALDTMHIIHRDGKTLYGGYYTQDQMREVIRYAAARHVEIIPEIDMPGHMMAAIKLYPYLSCIGEAGQGKLFSVPLCPCNESTFTFAENVYKEIFALFPSKYVHIGGDEVDKATWAQSPACKEVMQREGLQNVEELQSYFIKRMEKFFQAHDRRLIGWDEILEGGIDSTAIVMYWRGWVPKAPIEAARNGNEVIMTPGNPLYFDQWPDKSTLYNVYHFDPVPAGLTGWEKTKIMGAQANVWTERIPSEKRADYMTMPRMTALAELTWTGRPRDYASYLERLKEQYPRWDKMGIHYRLPDLEGFTDNDVFTDSTALNVQKPLPGLTVRYTTDGSIPGTHSPVLPQPFMVSKSMKIKIAAFSRQGNRGDIYTLKYEKESYAPPVTPGKALQNGLQCIYYEGFFDSTKKIATASPVHTYLLNGVMVPADIKAASFGLRFNGYINLPETGIYSFYLTSDDGSVLRVDGKTVVDNDGLHSAVERGGQMALQKGLHAFSLDFMEGGGGYTLRLKYSKQGGSPEDIPGEFFFCEKQ